MPMKNFYPVILAGGRGTRFWPLSRARRAKQVLALEGRRTMLQQTVARLAPLAPLGNFLVITNRELHAEIARQLPRLKPSQVLVEPAGRNTAPAIGLAAFLLQREDPDAVLGMFPSDHVIADERTFRAAVERAAAIAGRRKEKTMVVMGIRPTRPETGYGYIEAGSGAGNGVLRVRRFTEKPDAARAQEFLFAGNYFWNSGMFVWSARTLADALREHLPQGAKILAKIAAAHGTKKFTAVFKRLYPGCPAISIDYAVLEPRSAKGERASNLYCIPAEFGWNDLGSWAALYEHRARKHGDNVIDAPGSLALDSGGNFILAPGKFVAAVGVSDLVVVETADALLITTRERAQEVGKVVKQLEARRAHKLL